MYIYKGVLGWNFAEHSCLPIEFKKEAEKVYEKQ